MSENTEEPEELEELEELESLDEAEDLSEDFEPSDDAEPPLADSHIYVERPGQLAGMSKNVFQTSIFPVLFFTPTFHIIFANPACKRLFPNMSRIEGRTFFECFGKYFAIERVKEIRKTVLDGINGYSWKGKALIKSREHTTVETRVYLFPSNFSDGKPGEFGVLMDDVTAEMKGLLRSVFMSLLEASKLKDNDTGKHITRVNFYSEVLAKALMNRPGYDMVDADFIDNIAFLAAMHDVGKIGTPDDILHKEGPLSDFERSVMNEHTINGAFILSTYPNPMAKEIALSHHEKWDGSGYPYQFAGDLIPLSARIVSIADVYDALRMKRPYKPPFSHEVTMKKILESKGTQFDPELVDIMVTVSDEFQRLYDSNCDD
jgi:putative two-component system response regulator